MLQIAQTTRSPLGELFESSEVGAEGIEAPRGSIIYESGTVAEHLYYIHHGQVRLYQIGPDGEERLSEILGPGYWFGSSALSEGGIHISRAVAATQTQLSRVPAQRLLNHVARSPQAAAEMIRHLAGAVQTAREESARLVFQDCNQRLVSAMIRFSDSAAATIQGDHVVLHLTHEQLAQAVGAARETVSLALTEMRHLNLVRTGRNRLIFNREALRAFGNKNHNGNTNGHRNGHAVSVVA